MSARLRDFLDDVIDWSLRIMAAVAALLGAAGAIAFCVVLLLKWLS